MVPRSMTLARMIRLHKLPDSPRLLSRGLREMEERDVAQVHELYSRYTSRFGMSHIMSPEELQHHLLSGFGEGPRDVDSWKTPREGQVIWTYVVEVGIHARCFGDGLNCHAITEPRHAQNNRLHLVLFPPLDCHGIDQAQPAEGGVPLLLRNRRRVHRSCRRRWPPQEASGGARSGLANHSRQIRLRRCQHADDDGQHAVPRKPPSKSLSSCGNAQ